MFNNDTVLTKLCSSPGHLYKQDFSTLKCTENAELGIIITISNIYPQRKELLFLKIPFHLIKRCIANNSLFYVS